MKKFLLKAFMLLTLVLWGGVSAWAETVTWSASEANYANAAEVSNVTVNTNISFTFDKGTNSNAPKYYTSGTAIRAYAGNTISVSATNATITGVTFTFGSSDGSNAITANVGTFASPTWSGSAASVVFTIGGTSGNRRISGIEVSYTLGGGSGSGDGGGSGDGKDPDSGIALSTETVTLNSFASFSGSGYKSVTDYKINNISGFNVTDCMISSSKLQMKANSGKLVSPTVTSATGFDVKVTFSTNGSGFKLQVGESAAVTSTGSTVQASTDLSSATFTISAGSTYAIVEKIELIPHVSAPTSDQITISAAEYATYYNSTTAYIMPDDCEGYVFTAADGLEQAYDPGDVVPAGEPLVIYTIEPGTKTLVFTTSTEGTYKSGDMNDLEGTDEETVLAADDNYYFYGLSLNAAGDLDSVGFYWMNENGAAFTNGAHKAYLKLPQSSSARSGFAFNEETEALESVEMSAATTIYTLNGVKVNELQKGLNIVNGKKVMVK